MADKYLNLDSPEVTKADYKRFRRLFADTERRTPGEDGDIVTHALDEGEMHNALSEIISDRTKWEGGLGDSWIREMSTQPSGRLGTLEQAEGAQRERNIQYMQNQKAQGYAGGGQPQQPQQDPIVMGAVAAIMGQHPKPEQAVQAFVGKYGQQAFAQLRNQVIAEATQGQRQEAGIGSLIGQPQQAAPQGGLIQGPGDGRSDSIPATLSQGGKPVEEIAVSNNEYILPEKTTKALGVDNLDEIVRQTDIGGAGPAQA
jgi:hypothetical protein